MSSRRGKQPLVSVIVLGLVVVTGIIVLGGLAGLEDFGRSGEIWIWPVGIAFFAGADATVVRLHFRSETTAFTFLELPLFLGAIYITPSLVWATMTIGVGVSVAAQRLPFMKAVFNVANLSLQGAVGVWIFHQILGDHRPTGPFGWLAAGVAGVVSNALTALALIAVLLLVVQGSQTLAGMGQMLFLNAVTAITNVSLALIAASLLDYEPSALVLIVLPTAVLYGAYRAYTAERSQRDRVQAIHELALEVRSIRNEAGIIPVLRLAAEHMGAITAELILFPSDRGTGMPATRYRVSGELHEFGEVVSGELAAAVDRVHALPAPVRTNPSAGATSEMCGRINSGGQSMGLLVLRDRHRDDSEFSDDDLAMFTTTLEQLGLTLEKNQLGRAVTHLERRERQLQHEATHDALTGLANRTLLTAELDARLERRLQPSLLYLDLDDFKAVNDDLGHHAGDEVLIEITRRFTEAVGADDLVARIGGDEFAVLLHEAADDVAVAESLLRVASEPIETPDGIAIVNASIGVARAKSDSDSVNLLKRADVAMYRAKEAGKGALVVASR